MKSKMMYLLQKKAMKPQAPEMDDFFEAEMEDEPEGFERETMRIAAADLIEAIRSKNEIAVMDALETFMSCCMKS